MNIPDVDLNLLSVLDALLETGSVSAAARRLRRSQPAVSHSLARLRELLDDPLLVRTSRGMQPTPRALALRPSLRQALAALEQALAAPRAFDPARATRVFTVASRDWFDVVLLPALVARLRALAPSIGVRRLPSGERPPIDELEEGTVDLALGFFPKVAGALRQQKLVDDELICVMRAGHPAARKRRLTLDEYVRHAHALVSPVGSATGWVDTLLAERGLKRTIAAWLPDFAAMPLLVAQTDLIVTLSAHVARAFAALPLVTRPAPLPVRGFPVAQLWSAQRDLDEPHRWFRGLVADVARSL